jgi:hypothetical protein
MQEIIPIRPNSRGRDYSRRCHIPRIQRLDEAASADAQVAMFVVVPGEESLAEGAAVLTSNHLHCDGPMTPEWSVRARPGH